MAIHGVIDARFVPSNQLKFYSEFYVTMTRFLTSSYAESMGIQRIAYNTGSSATGEQYWDEGRPVGSNAWSAYKFLSSSVPFYMFVQFNDSNTANTAPGFPGSLDLGVSTSGVGFAFALRPDGSSPWNGTTLNNGNDRKAIPVWVPASGSNQLFVWPRSNSISGSSEVRRDCMMSVPIARSVTPNPSPYSRCHFICDENHILVTADEGGTDAYGSLYFGTYVPRSGTNPAIPYVALRTTTNPTDPHFNYTTYGSLSSDTTNSTTGGVAHPTELVSGTRTVQVATVSTFLAAGYGPNGAIGNSATYDEWPLYLALAETPQFGYIGYIDWIRYIYGVGSLVTTPDLSRVFIGNSVQNSTKISVPWDGRTVPGVGLHRTGVMF